MYKVIAELRGVKVWEVLLVFRDYSENVNDREIKGDDWSIRIIKEDTDIVHGIEIPVIHIEAEGNKEKINKILKEIKLRLFKASGI
ncbi:MAG: hypothetical protein ACP5IZ_08040 [Thermoprotei archaeon]|jgi:hypothetical protein